MLLVWHELVRFLVMCTGQEWACVWERERASIHSSTVTATSDLCEGRNCSDVQRLVHREDTVRTPISQTHQFLKHTIFFKESSICIHDPPTSPHLTPERSYVWFSCYPPLPPQTQSCFLESSVYICSYTSNQNVCIVVYKPHPLSCKLCITWLPTMGTLSLCFFLTCLYLLSASQ